MKSIQFIAQVKCNKETIYQLTFGKNYDVIEEISGIYYKIKRDDGSVVVITKDNFWAVPQKYALGSTVSAGLLCKDGHEIKVSTDFSEGGRYEGLVMIFDTLEEANQYIEETGSWALEPIKYTEE